MIPPWEWEEPYFTSSAILVGIALFPLVALIVVLFS